MKNLDQIKLDHASSRGKYTKKFEALSENDKLRMESMERRWWPVKGQGCWTYQFKTRSAVKITEPKGALYWMGNLHKTKQEAELWGIKYADSWNIDKDLKSRGDE